MPRKPGSGRASRRAPRRIWLAWRGAMYPIGLAANHVRFVTCPSGDKPSAVSTPREASMGRAGRRASAIAALLVLLSAVGVGVVGAGNRSTDERALKKTRAAESQTVGQKVSALLGKMTLQEKLNQMTLLSDGQMVDGSGQINTAEARKPVGSVFSLTNPEKINEIQHDAVEHSRLHIPILFAFDTIH